MPRESIQYDVVIVGAGPAGLASAIRLKQLAQAANTSISVCIVEKGSEVGAHILSGAIMDPCALNELIPDWQARGAPLNTLVRTEQFLWLSETESVRLPMPPSLRNHKNYIISLSHVCRWLAQQAEALGVDIFPGFAASEVLYDAKGHVKGVATSDMGLGRGGEKTPSWQAGMEIVAKQTLLAEGCRGSLSQVLIKHFALDKHCDPQSYGIGIKELWEIRPEYHEVGKVIHTIGWPLKSDTYGGSFLYHLENNQLAVGFVVGLDYANPYLSPFEELQRFKTHPAIRRQFSGARRIAYGARALNEGGVQAQPRLTFPGGALIGDCAGFLNVARLKGSHAALKSGMLAATAVFDCLTQSLATDKNEASAYTALYRRSWLYEELWKSRNIRPAFRKGLWAGLFYAALDTYLFRGRAPWTFHIHQPDHACLKNAQETEAIVYPKPDGVLTFDRLSSVFLAHTHHRDDQPVHLKIKDERLPIDVNLAQYLAPETRYCPAGVYEIVDTETSTPRLQINAQNCVHCKSCDIKDPRQNIQWVVPEGGSGPNYPNM